KPKPFVRQVITEEELTDISESAHQAVKAEFDTLESRHKFLPPSEKGTLLIGYSGGAEWGGNAIDDEGILYVNANEEPWVVKMIDANRFDHKKGISEGEKHYLKNCAMCHGADRKGGAQFPELLQVKERMKKEQFLKLVRSGSGRMPAFPHVSETEVRQLLAYIWGEKETLSVEEAEHLAQDRQQQDTVFGFRPRYLVASWKQFKDPEGYPGIKPPWGTLTAINLHTGDHLWQVPLGTYPELRERSIATTGTDNYGGPVVTAGGLVFIAATKDSKIRAFDSSDGKILWEYELPEAGFATPVTYTAKGKQYMVIAAGGGRRTPSGGKYIAFSLD
ncbi:c-type cytochrome, partial [Sinomicrobium oceani]|uniref:c-type cytochrome n=1 Tax=Sinomicrobium oceani TaxID=1150368 RepID=UPI00227CBC26